MAITYDGKQRVFTLATDHSAYQMKVDDYGCLLHLYYGAPVTMSMDYLLTYYDRGFSGNPYEAGADRTYSMDTLPQEYPCRGTGDYRSTCLEVKGECGASSCDLRYHSHSICKGKYGLPGLPAAYGGEEDADTLEIIMKDEVNQLTVTLYYGVFDRYDVITRAEKLENGGSKKLVISKAQTACLDFLDDGYDLLAFYGRHAMERNLQRAAIGHGSTVISSRRGASSHHYSSFIIAARAETTEDHGLCYGMNFVYSGNFKAEAETDQVNQTRITMGLSDELFSWNLEAGECFYTPEVLLSCSTKGLSMLSGNYHKMIRKHICRGKYKEQPRPVLINNWEATYFDFTGSRIVEIAKQAAELGVDMMVLDDGWFGKRDSDNSGLGDWYVNEEKLGRPLSELVKEINGTGMKFGIWVEPEMVSEDSDLYRAHPDWAFAVPGKKPVRSRNQLVLDFSRPEVVTAVYDQICRVLDSANIEYIKWDMNRSITDVYSAALSPDRQGEALHRYVLGLYDFLERMVNRYPDLLIEGCSGGGGRFDAGMLYYTPQIWCSDNTDAIDRTRIQYGTSFGFPVSAVGSHVSAVPNHQTGRVTPMETRGVVAMAGSFGYELDLNKITEEEKKCVKQQIKKFRQYDTLIHQGDYYRLTNPFQSENAVWEFVLEDKTEALVSLVRTDSHGNNAVSYIHLRGLQPDAWYEEDETGRRYTGEALMCGGLPVAPGQEYSSEQIHLKISM